MMKFQELNSGKATLPKSSRKASADISISSETLNTATCQRSIATQRVHTVVRDTPTTNFDKDSTVRKPTSANMADFSSTDGPQSITIQAGRCSPENSASDMSALTAPFSRGSTKTQLQYHDVALSKNDSRRNQRHLELNNPILRVSIESSIEENTTSFLLPVSVMLQREVEMQAAARTNRIGKERWTSSRIFRMWKAQYNSEKQKANSCVLGSDIDGAMHENTGEIVLRLTPEVSLNKPKAPYNHFFWKPWLSSSIQSYYDSGKLHIPNECSGDDILLALEYFGILTASPNDFIFASRDAYKRIQAWSRYFTHRRDLVDTFLDSIHETESEDRSGGMFESDCGSHRSYVLVWVLVEEKDIVKYHSREFKLIKGNDDRRSSVKTVKTLLVKQTGCLYDLFSDKKVFTSTHGKGLFAEDGFRNDLEENVLTREMPSLMRKDFCNFLKLSLPPWCNISFTFEMVELACSLENTGRTVESRPVIRIHFNNSKYAMGSNSSMCHRIRHKGPEEDVKNRSCGRELYRSSTPENNHKVFNDMTGKNRFIPVEASTASQKSRTPIQYVDTELGDLRSVTSALSEPILDHSMVKKGKYVSTASTEGPSVAVLELSPIRDTAKRIIRETSGRRHKSKKSALKLSHEDYVQLKTPPRTMRKLPTGAQWILDQSNHSGGLGADNLRDKRDRYKSCETKGHCRKQLLHNYETKDFQGTEYSEWDDENSEYKSQNSSDDIHGSWGHLLASMCEVIIPVDSGNILSSSPTRNFTVRSNKSAAPIAIMHESNKQTTNHDDRWDDQNAAYNLHKSNGIVDQAKKFGNELSNQIDELMKIAYSENDDGNTNDDFRASRNLPPIREEVPGILSIHSDEERTLTSCLTSSIVGQPFATQASETLQQCGGKDENHSSQDSYKNQFCFHSSHFDRSRKSKIQGGNGMKLNSRVARLQPAVATKQSSSTVKQFAEQEGTRDSPSSKTYNKENRYSRTENRFYS